MNYFIDTEFLEGTQRERFPISLFRKETKPTIDLISIGIVAEDGREYYAISKDFNLDEAWNRRDIKTMTNLPGDTGTNKMKVYWIRENVLYPIFAELFQNHNPEIWAEEYGNLGNFRGWFERNGNGKKRFKELLNIYGKTNEQIAEEIRIFVANRPDNKTHKDILENEYLREQPKFYAYYADYDWVAFCWLFGKMMDLPNGFPMYCRDLKQDYDFFNENFIERKKQNAVGNIHKSINELKNFKDYPKQENEHNALDDARWNKELYKFLNIFK